MATNIEIKARLKDFDGAQQRAARISDTPVDILRQTDTFFHTPQGRLKLRELPDHSQLIYYERADVSGPKASNYLITRTQDKTETQNLKALLSAALGIRGIVKKERYLYLAGNTRIHLDKVEGLGNFLELEVVLEADDAHTAGERTAVDLMQKLGVEARDLVNKAYIDLLKQN